MNEVWAVDTEWGFTNHGVDHESAFVPVVLCAVGLRSGQRLDFWGWDVRLAAFFAAHTGDTFVAHNVVAEMKYLLRLDVPLPATWFDTYVAWRLLTNKPGLPEASLTAALGNLGLPHITPVAKEELQQRILHLRFDPHDLEERNAIIEYCQSDCDGAAAIFEHVHTKVRPEVMTHWVEYLKAVSRMELWGIPFDAASYRQIASNQPAIRTELIAQVNATAPIYNGESFSKAAFLGWCRRQHIAWPVQKSDQTGQLYQPLDDGTFKSMETHHPFIAQVRQVRKTLTRFGQRTLVVDPITRRHYYSTSAFRSVTGRNQPRNFVFGGPKWFRYLIVPESPDHVLVYVDYVAQEIGIAAALSGDRAMAQMYAASDCHLDLAIRAGAAPPDATKQTHSAIRKRYKTVNLGVLYGQTAHGIAARLGIDVSDAESLLDGHRNLFPAFWVWSERIVQGSIDRGWIRTPCGWQSRVPPFHNDRTWMNWPMQATGGDIMRLTITYLDMQNVRILAPVHDGFLLSCRRDQLGDLQAAVDYACQQAVDHVLPGFPLRWESTVYDNGRFEDDDGLPLWQKLQAVMQDLAHGVDQPTEV